MYRRFAPALAPLLDVLVFNLLLGMGLSARVAQLAAFAAGTVLTWALGTRAIAAAAQHCQAWVLYRRLLIVTLMAALLRGVILGLFINHWHWPAQAAIVMVVASGLAVTLPGYVYSLSSATGDSRWRAFAVALIAYSIVLRLIFAASVELMPEETYYWNYSRHLDLGYVDHPPMVAWLIYLGTAVFGQSEFGVRSGAILCGLITSVFIYRLSRAAFGERSALAALVLAQVLPFFFLSGVLMTPDAPLTAAWAATLFFLERALIAGQSGAWWRMGVSAGLGLISKYTIALLGPVALAFMLWDSQSRLWLRRYQPYLAALLALAVFAPVIIWNSQHEWVSFAFQTSRRLAEPPKFTLHRLIGSILVLITPTAAVAAALTVASGSKGAEATVDYARRRRLLLLATLVPLSVFAVFSLRHEVKLDWTGALWTAALPLLGCGMTTLAGGRDLHSRVRAAWAPTLMVLVLIYTVGLQYLVSGLPGFGYSRYLNDLPVAWRDLSRSIGAAAAAYSRETHDKVLIVGMDRYAIASELAFYGMQQSHSTVETSNSHLFEGMGLMYSRWTPPYLQEHRNLLLVSWEPGDLQGGNVESHAQRLGPLESGVLTRDGSTIRTYYYRMLYDYRSIASGTAIDLK